MFDVAIITTGLGVLVILTNAFTELFKKMFPSLIPQIVATVIAMILTVCAVMAYVTITGIAITWYIVVGSIIGGLFVSYTAQFGFDKAKEILKLIGGGKS